MYFYNIGQKQNTKLEIIDGAGKEKQSCFHFLPLVLKSQLKQIPGILSRHGHWRRLKHISGILSDVCCFLGGCSVQRRSVCSAVSLSPSTSVGMFTYQTYPIRDLRYQQVSYPLNPPSALSHPFLLHSSQWTPTRASEIASLHRSRLSVAKHLRLTTERQSFCLLWHSTPIPCCLTTPQLWCHLVFSVWLLSATADGHRVAADIKARGWRRRKFSGLMSPCSLRLVFAELHLKGLLTLCSMLLPGLNNKCARLPLALKAAIISLGLTITHALGFRDGWVGRSKGSHLSFLFYVWK